MKNTPDDTPPEREHPQKPLKKRRNPLLLGIGTVIAVVLLGIGTYLGYAYAASPLVIRDPLLEHYHFRMQILINGKALNFGDSAYQTGYSKDQCNAKLPAQPIHFHDNKDQFVHIHWEGITGGQVMKYYGWNYIGGMDSVMGYRFDDLPRLTKVNIHGDSLPQVPKDANFYVYTGDEKKYQEKSFNDWKKQDLEKFFNNTSNFPAHDLNMEKRSGVLDAIFPRAFAHEGHDHPTTPTNTGAEETTEQRLTRINNLVGNVVIFVQKDKPTDAQIKDRFNKLVPLTESTCGG